MIFQYTLEKKENEINKYFLLRESFIKLLKPKNNKEFKLYEAYSNIFINMFFFKCRYTIKTEKFIKKFIKNYKDKLIIDVNKNIE
jgi:predicted GIY-YIG superfamily endonuclease